MKIEYRTAKAAFLTSYPEEQERCFFMPSCYAIEIEKALIYATSRARKQGSNAPSTIGNYYTSLVAHDMASGALAPRKPRFGDPDYYSCNAGESL